MTAPTVFISYSHDSALHADRVLALADRLVGDGIDAILDQYETSPPEGWPRWMDRHIRRADFVLMVCTATYCRRVMGEEPPGTRRGVKWEGSLIYQHIYQADTTNARFIPVLFEDGRVDDIPTPLQGATHCCVEAPDGYEALYRRLTNQPRVTKPALGQLRALPPRERQTDFLATVTPAAAAADADVLEGYRRIVGQYQQNLLAVEARLAVFIDPAAVPPDLERTRDSIVQKIAEYEARIRGLAPKPITPAAPKISLAKLPSTSPDLFGRDGKLAALDAAWDDPHTNVYCLVAWGGVGKTALVNRWLTQLGQDDYRGAARVFGWSFYSQGAAEGRQVSADPFIAVALEWFGDPDPTRGSAWDKGERLAELVRQARTLLILDGLEPLQYPPGPLAGQLKDPALAALLKGLA